MFQGNVNEVLGRLAPTDLVLDVGGWACPFNRAQWVIDSQPYESRGFYKTVGLPASQGGDTEWFSEATWVRRDICDREPWPFRDRQFDFVICSHTLEDVRDPVGVCAEMVRVGKRGYIEVPSREWEATRGIERAGQAGLSHHRWLITIRGDRIDFLPKYHMIHTHPRFSLPPSHLDGMTWKDRVQWLWWDGSFEFGEVALYGVAEQEAELARFVRAVRPRPPRGDAVDRWVRRARSVRAALPWKRES